MLRFHWFSELHFVLHFWLLFGPSWSIFWLGPSFGDVTASSPIGPVLHVPLTSGRSEPQSGKGSTNSTWNWTWFRKSRLNIQRILDNEHAIQWLVDHKKIMAFSLWMNIIHIIRCISRRLEVQGLTLDCHTVHGNFLRGNPTNVAVVFDANKDTMALSHNATCQKSRSWTLLLWVICCAHHNVTMWFKVCQSSYESSISCDVIARHNSGKVCRRAKDSEFRSGAMPGRTEIPDANMDPNSGLGVCDSIILVVSCFFDLLYSIVVSCVMCFLLCSTFLLCQLVVWRFTSRISWLEIFLMKRLCSTRK